MKSIIRSLRHRNFRLYFFGQGLSVTGTWMQSVAMGWLVYRLTGSKALLGLAGFASQILTFAVAPFAGVLADRWNRRRTIIAAQVLAMAQALALASVTLTGVVQWWHVVALSIFTGLVRGFEVPTRQSFIVQMLDERADLPNAIALNSFLVNTARLVGPLIAGGIIAAVAEHGEGVVFLINGISYATIIVALVAMRIAPRHREPAGDVLAGLKEGLAYAWRTPTIRTVLGLLALSSLVAVPYSNLLPAFAKDTHLLAGGPDTLGYLMGAAGVGSLLAGVLLAYRREAIPLRRILLGSAVLFGLGLIAFALLARYESSLWLALPVLVWVGLAMTAQMYACNTLLQTTSDENKRGRVMSLYTMAFMGVIPFGAILTGWLAEVLDARLAVWGPAYAGLGAPVVVAVGGVILTVGTVLLGRRLPKGIRPSPATMERVEAPE
ncbi:MAG: MFS transporter [Phycisphaerae bacterium]